MPRIITGLAAIVVAAAFIGPAGAQPRDRVAAGTLTCDVSAGFGLILGSRKDVACTFTPAAPGPIESYFGTITKVGVDIGATTRSIMVWAVWAPTTRGAGSLAGNYAGATAEATAGVGVGANVLIGGSNRTVELQPLSVTGQTGLNVAGGIAELSLRFGR